MKTIQLTLLALFTVTLFIGCGTSAWITPTTPTDTPENNYHNGMRALQSGNHSSAMSAFERAKGLDPDFAPAYEGIGLVHLAQDRFEEAEASFKASIERDDEYAPAYIGLGRVYIAQGKYSKGRKQFDKAIVVDRRNIDAHYYKGQSYMEAHQFADARKWFRKTLSLDNAHRDADRDWAKADKIERAMPGTALGTKIALQDEISRADLSVLLIEELKLDRIFRTVHQLTVEVRFSSLNPPELTDVDGHCAEAHIRTVVRLGVLTSYPDNTFRPNEPVRHQDFAVTVQNVLTTVLGKDILRTRFVGGRTAFADLPSSHFAYNAALLTTTRGILAADVETGNFRPMKVISGADALLGLRQMAHLLP